MRSRTNFLRLFKDCTYQSLLYPPYINSPQFCFPLFKPRMRSCPPYISPQYRQRSGGAWNTGTAAIQIVSCSAVRASERGLWLVRLTFPRLVSEIRDSFRDHLVRWGHCESRSKISVPVANHNDIADTKSEGQGEREKLGGRDDAVTPHAKPNTKTASDRKHHQGLRF